jgi:hypothetical protein
MVIGEFDIIPDDINWKDTGCEVHPSCLDCPLDKCMEEEPRGRQRLRMLARARYMAELKKQGKSLAEISRVFQVSQRTVQRDLAKNKDNGEVKANND